MPTYEYACLSCGTHIEVFQHFNEESLTECGVCGGPLRKVFHPAGILFKGSGFYATDSRASRSKGPSGDGERTERAGAGTGAEKTGSKVESGSKGDSGSNGESGSKGEPTKKKERPAAKEGRSAGPSSKEKSA
jgi:putative FmdB family regulatory protein